MGRTYIKIVVPTRPAYISLSRKRRSNVTSINGKIGDLILTAEDVEADPEGSAAAALVAASEYTDEKIAAIPPSDPEGSAATAEQAAKDYADDLVSALPASDPAGSAAAAEASAKSYADGLVVGLWDDRGTFNASGNTFPATGGSGASGVIKKGDIWTISVAGALGGSAVAPGDTVRALQDTPGQTSGNWAIAENNLGYTPVSLTGAETLTNKRITERVLVITSSATPTINTDNYDCVSITALATAITSMTSNLSGTPTDMQPLVIRFKDNGIARAINWGAAFESKGTGLPITTPANKVLTVGFFYDTVTSKWGCVGAQQEP
jgi:hypothetical protein